MEYKIFKGNCLELHSNIQDGECDLVLMDPPYGNMDTDGGRRLGINEWDKTIAPKELFTICNRILRRNGKLILFSQEPYTSRLITEALPNLPFSYRCVWEKDAFANALGSKKAPVSYFEDILVFSKNHDVEGLHPLRAYFKLVYEFVGLKRKEINKTLGHRRAEHAFYIESTQFSLCTEQTYEQLIQVFSIDKMQGFKPYDELKALDDQYKQRFASTFNLWQGGKYKSNIFKYRKEYTGHHPTQKPVELLRDLIKTYSNEGDTVADLTMGSGSTGVACGLDKRKFYGVELNDYFSIAEQRIEEAYNPTQIKLF